MSQYNLQNIKKEPMTKLDSLLMFFSILMLISAIMCTAVAAISLYLQGTNMVTLYLLAAATFLGGVSIVSIKQLQRKHNQ